MHISGWQYFHLHHVIHGSISNHFKSHGLLQIFVAPWNNSNIKKKWRLRLVLKPKLWYCDGQQRAWHATYFSHMFCHIFSSNQMLNCWLLCDEPGSIDTLCPHSMTLSPTAHTISPLYDIHLVQAVVERVEILHSMWFQLNLSNAPLRKKNFKPLKSHVFRAQCDNLPPTGNTQNSDST